MCQWRLKIVGVVHSVNFSNQVMEYRKWANDVPTFVLLGLSGLVTGHLIKI